MEEINKSGRIKSLSAKGNDNLLVLIIDPDMNSRLLLGDLIFKTSKDAKFDFAANFAEALMLVGHNRYHIVFVHNCLNFQEIKDLSGPTTQEFHSFAIVLFVDEPDFKFSQMAIRHKLFDIGIFPPTCEDLSDFFQRLFTQRGKERFLGYSQQHDSGHSPEMLVSFKISEGWLNVPSGSILYCEAFGHHCIMLLSSSVDTIIVHESLLRVDYKLAVFGYKRMGKFYVVNPNRILRFITKSHSILLHGDTFIKEISLSTKVFRTLVREQFSSELSHTDDSARD